MLCILQDQATVGHAHFTIDVLFKIPLYAIIAIFTILLCNEISIASSVLLFNYHNRYAAYCKAKANMM